MLEEHAHAHVQAHPLLVADVVDVDLEEPNRAVLLLVQSEHRAQQDRLAGTRCTDEAEDLAAVDVEIQPVEHHLIAEGNPHVSH